MANRPEYIPELNDSVTMEGVDGSLVVVGVDTTNRVARVRTETTPVILYTVPWSKLSYLDERKVR